MRQSRYLLILVLLLAIFAQAPDAGAGQAKYFYDDLGRLSQVVDEQGNVATYTYDAVGNLLSITTNTGGAGAPTIASIIPTQANVGQTVAVVLSGSGLGGAALSTDNPGIAIGGVQTATSSIHATFTISYSARTGPTIITARTAAGPATITFIVNAGTPVISELGPDHGPVSRLLRINGQGFGGSPAQISVTFGGIAASVINATATRIDTQVPAGVPAGSLPVVVTVGGIPSQAKSFFVDGSAARPVITSIAPLRGSEQGGDTIRIRGSGFSTNPIPTVSIGDYHLVKTTYYARSCIPAPPAKSPFGQFLDSPQISAGSGGGGVIVIPCTPTIVPINFYKFLGIPATKVTIIDDTTMDIVTPPGPAGPAHILISNMNGDALLTNGFTYLAGAPEQLVGITPLPGLINIATNTPMTIRFTRPVDRTTITAANFGLKVTSTGSLVSGNFSFSGGDTVATFRPTSTLTVNTQYTLTITQGISSADGLPLGGGFTGTFITGTVPDTASPTVTITPANGATGVPFNTAITFTFSEGIDPFTLTGLQVVNQGESRNGTIFFSGQNSVATFVSASPFVPTTPVTVTLSGNATDIAGNKIVGSSGVGSDLVSQFTTATVSDVIPPRVLKINPTDGATGINTNTAISATFTESLNPATINTNSFLVSSGGVNLAGAVVLSNFNTVATFLPSQPLPALTQINVTLTTGIKDVTGNAMVAPFNSIFTTQSAIDNFRPSVISVNPFSGQTNVPLNTKITIRFDERINPLTVNSSTFSMNGPAGPISGAIAVAADQLSATFTPAQPLLPNGSPGITYTSGIQDIAGNPLFNPATVGFTTGSLPTDTGGPSVVMTSPAPGAQGVARNAPILIQFSEPVAATSVTKQTVILSVGGVPVEEELTLEQNNTVIRVKSANLVLLQANTLYGIAVTFGVTDTAGNSPAAQFTSAFTTGSATDTIAPTVVSTSPAINATNVPRSTPITVTFSEPIDPITANTGSFTLTGGGADGPLPGSFSFSSDRKTVTFIPSSPLFANLGYAITSSAVVQGLSKFIEDVAGNTLATTTSVFTTGYAAGTDLNALPNGATVVANPNRLYADGQTTTTVTISNISNNGALVPNGTKIAVTADPAYRLDSGGGTILGGTVSAADPRFKIFTTLGGSVTFTYRSSNHSDLIRGGTLTAFIQVAQIDAAEAPMRTISSASITLTIQSSITSSPNPTNLLAAAGSSSHLTITVFDGFGNAVPAGRRVAVTADPVYRLTSLGGSILGGIQAGDSRFKIFSAITGGIVELDYTPPILQSSQSGTAFIQVAEVDDSGNLVGLLGSGAISLDGSSGFTAPQPVVLATSPANGQSNLGLNAPIVVSFSQSLDPATVTSTTFSVSSGGAVAGSRTLSAGVGGPNSVITFTPNTPWNLNAAVSVFVGTGIKSVSGNPLLASKSFTFSSGTASDTTAPFVALINPPDGATGVGTNTVVMVQFSENINAVSVTPQSMTLSAGGTMVSGRVTVISKIGDSATPSLIAIFTPDQLLATNTLYTMNLTAAITDTAGNALAPFTSGFTTTSGIDNFQPSVIIVSPYSGETGVPQNAKITLVFSEKMNPQTINTNTLKVTGPGGPIAGAITVSADQLSATFTPSVPLLPNGSHGIDFTDQITDIAGNKLFNASSGPTATGSIRTFTTGAGPGDAASPSVITTSPADGAAAVPINANVLVQFNEPIAGTSINAQTFVVSTAGVPLPGLVVLEQNGTVIRWKPANLALLSANASYQVSISGSVIDLAGNALSAPFTTAFTTGSASDTTAPTVVSRGPAGNATSVSRSTPIVVTFSEPIDPITANSGSFTLTGGGADGPLPGSFSFSSDRKTVTFTPAARLFANQSYTVTTSVVSAGTFLIEDIAGNALASVFSVFSTAFAAGTNLTALPTAATAIANPTRLYSDGQTTTTVTISNINRSGVLVPNGTQIAVTADPAYRLDSAGGTILGGSVSAPDPRFKIFTTLGGSVTFTYRSSNHPEALGPLTAYIQAAQVDLAGAPMGFIGSGAITLSAQANATINFNPTSLLAVSGSYSHAAMTLFDSFGAAVPAGRRIAVTADPVYVSTALGGSVVGGILAADSRFKIFTTITGGIIEFDYTPPILAPNQNGNAYIQVVEVDDAGNLIRFLGSFAIVLSGSTGFTAPQPMVLATSPANGQSNVGLNAPIVVSFSQSLDPATVTSTTFSISSGGAVAGARTLSAGVGGPNSVITFTPNTPWSSNAAVSVFIGTGIKSVSGNPLLASKSFTFSSGTASDTTAPSVALINPADGASGVGTNIVIMVQFSESINAVSVTPQSMTLSAGGTMVSGRVTVISKIGDSATPSLIAIFTPDQLLATNTAYTVNMTAAITDTAGNALTPFTSSFTTTSGIDNFQPSVISVSPYDRETGVPQNAKIILAFSEKMNPQTINANTFKLSGPGGPIAGTITVSADQLSATFLPSIPLLPNGSHGIDFGDQITDIAGNKLLNPTFGSISFSFPKIFTTGAGPGDASSPSVIGISPADGAAAVPINANVLVQFSEPIAGTSINDQSVVVSTGGIALPGLIVLEQNNTVVRWKPANLALLSANALYQVSISGSVIDIAGNLLTAPFTSAFTTGSTSDTIAPTVVSRSPTTNAINIPRSTPIVVTFSKPIDPMTVNSASFTLTGGGGINGAVPGSFSFSSDRKTVTFTPAAPLFANQFYSINTSVQSSGGLIEDVAGNTLASVTSAFTTAFAAGTNLTALPTAATVLSNPDRLYADGQTTTTVTISNVNRSGVIVPNGTKIAVTADPTYRLDSAGGILLGGVTSASDPRFKIFTTLAGSVTFTYQSSNHPEFARGASLPAYIQVAQVDLEETPMQVIGNGTITLFRGNSATITPNPGALLVASGSTSHITVTVFGNDSNPVPAGGRIGVTADPVYVSTSLGGSIVGGDPAADSRFKIFTTITGGTVEFDYTPPTLALNQSGSAYIQAVEVDDSGNLTGGQLNSAPIDLSRTTGFTAPQPVVLSTSPANGQSRVGLNAPIVVSFSQSIDPATVTAITFSISSGGAVAGVRTLSAGVGGPNSVITFTPNTPWSPNAAVGVSVGSSIKSVSGNPLLTSKSVTFSTGLTSDTAAPSVILVNPANGASGAGTNTQVTVQFSESINAVSVTPQSMTLSAGGTPVSGRVTVTSKVGDSAAPSLIATFIPDQRLSPNRAYTINLTSAVTDTAGNALTPFTSTFTTATGIDSFQPSVLTITPANGSLDVPSDITVTVTFSEPMNPNTINDKTFTFSGPGGTVNAIYGFTNGNTVVTLTPSQPLFAGGGYTISLSTSISDLAGNFLPATVISGFTTALAPGTANLSNSAAVTVNPGTLFANGQVSTTVIISNIKSGGTLVPNGTIIAVTAQPAFNQTSVGGTISGSGAGNSADPRFLLFSTFGAQVTVSYTPPDLTGKGAGNVGEAAIQVASVDVDGRPVNQIGSGTVSLFGIGTATLGASPNSIAADGISVSHLTITVKDAQGNLVPDGTRVSLTAAPIFSPTSAGGTILGGLASAVDGRVKIFTTAGGQLATDYQAPSATGSGTAIVQAMTIDADGHPTALLGTTTITLTP